MDSFQVADYTLYWSSWALLALLASLPFSLQGKWMTGIKKKEFEGSAIPASMMYHATKPGCKGQRNLNPAVPTHRYAHLRPC